MSSSAEGLDELLLPPHHRHPHERILLDVVHAPAPGEEGLDLTLAAVLGTGAHAAVADPAHEQVDMCAGPKALTEIGQLELVDRAAEVTEGLGVGLHGTLSLALDLAGLEVEGDGFFECFHVQPPLIRWSHITPSCRG